MPPMLRKRATRVWALRDDRRVAGMQVGLAVMAVPTPVLKRFLALPLEVPESDEAALLIRRECLRLNSALA